MRNPKSTFRYRFWLAAASALTGAAAAAVVLVALEHDGVGAGDVAPPSFTSTANAQTVGNPAPRPVPPQQQQQASQPQQPSSEVRLILIRSALYALQLSNLTGDYQTLFALCSPNLQARTNLNEIRATFASLRSAGIDLSPTLVLIPQLHDTSGVLPNGTLRLNGMFPTQPLKIEFALDFAPIGGGWRIEAISVVAEPRPGPSAGRQTIGPAPSSATAKPAQRAPNAAPAKP